MKKMKIYNSYIEFLTFMRVDSELSLKSSVLSKLTKVVSLHLQHSRNELSAGNR